jgi:hypothetical protein
MDIEKALETLTGFLDELSFTLSDEELELIGEAEDAIYKFIKNHKEEKC